jgi:3-oxoacyl-(acyl-carrier-protein) synthase
VRNFNIKDFGIEKKYLEDIKIWKNSEEVSDLFYLMAAAKLAIDDSRLKYNKECNQIGLILAHENPGIYQFAERILSASFNFLNNGVSKKDFFQKMYSFFKKSAYDLQTFMYLFHIGKTLGLHGFFSFLNNACASGLYALENASMLIINGHATAVVVAATDCSDIFKYLWFKELGMYASDGRIKPFSKDADGFVFGDGGAGLVLEDFKSAIDRKATIYAEYLGGAFAFEGWKVTFPAVGKTYYRDTILKALSRCDISEKEIDLVVPHGAGLKVADQYEADALQEIFKNEKEKPIYSAFKPYVGHNLGGSALLETIILLLTIKNQIIPPTLNFKKNLSSVDINLLSDFSQIPVNVALKTSSAFAGFDAAVLFRKYIK